MSRLVEILCASVPEERDTAFEEATAALTSDELLQEAQALEAFRHESREPYTQVRALLYLHAIHRYALPAVSGALDAGKVDEQAWRFVLQRRFEEAISLLIPKLASDGLDEALCSSLAAAYRGRAFQFLSSLVRRSVRAVRGNNWMFRMGHPLDHPLRIRPEFATTDEDGAYPILREATPVRMDLTHSGWSDIFFLGMDFPEGARVINASIGLSIHGRGERPEPPIECFLRVIDEPVLRLCSVDLEASVDLTRIGEVFDFARDHLGLLKAGLCAAGLVPPGLEGSEDSLRPLLDRVVGPGLGLELVTHVHGIPKGSRLAVSTNLLASILSVTMRATGQTESMEGPLLEHERRLVAARAILGEWLGGSGGGWQDSGGLWPGLKLIRGVLAKKDDVESGSSRGRLLPSHHLLHEPGEVQSGAGAEDELPARIASMIHEGLVLVHGGMAQDVGPILEIVTEKYLLRSAEEWRARGRAAELCDEILEALAAVDLRRLARATTETFDGPVRTIVPQATNHFTEELRRRIDEEFGEHSLGFLMLGGMSGGGMGFWIDPEAGEDRQERVAQILLQTKRDLAGGLPFAMDPVVYDFRIDRIGTRAEWMPAETASMPDRYHALVVPELLRQDRGELSRARRVELERLGELSTGVDSRGHLVPALLERLLPGRAAERRSSGRTLQDWLAEAGFDATRHERIRADLLAGRIGLARNRLSPSTTIEDVRDADVVEARTELPSVWRSRGRAAIAGGEVAVVTFAGGAASRWAGGAGLVKGLNPFCEIDGAHRSFVGIHLAKTRRLGRELGVEIPHVLTTSPFTHDVIRAAVDSQEEYRRGVDLHLSPGRTIGLRLVPTQRDLRFHFHETARQVLDERAQKVRDSAEKAQLEWARQQGEGSDYTDNEPLLCLHPAGHWYEVPNMLRNGTLRRLYERYPRLRYLLVHHVDSVGVDLDPSRLGLHAERGAALSFEVVPRRADDVGGALARVDGRVRLVEGLAMPNEHTEWQLRYYNTGTTWVDIDQLLAAFQLGRDDLEHQERVDEAVRAMEQRMPTYVTVKMVKRRFGRAQEELFAVEQFEKLWGDLSAHPELAVDYHIVPRSRGEQLKEPAQLDGWIRDGSLARIAEMCQFG